jgi:hypothetical protein
MSASVAASDDAGMGPADARGDSISAKANDPKRDRALKLPDSVIEVYSVALVQA